MSNTDGPSKLERLIEEQERIDAQRMAALQAEQPEEGAPPRSMSRKRRLTVTLSALAVVLVAGVAIGIWALQNQDTVTIAQPTTTPAATPTPTPTPTPEPSPEPQWDVDSPGSLQVVVNKQRPLDPIGWIPDELVWPDIPNPSGEPLHPEAAQAAEQMFIEAQAAGLPFWLVSGYRDFAYQEQLFNNFSANYGVEEAETFSARPGHSEHQTGLAIDISECDGCGLTEAFGDTPQGIWVRENAHRFGYIMRYHAGEQATVGYVYEPWHFRYVGTEIATDMYENGILNLEDYFGLPAAPTY